MRRRRFDATSGLDLFLDAICNTFGGIVFVSMLVVVLINATSVSSVEDPTATPPPDAAHLQELQREKIAIEEQIRRLEEASEILQDSPGLADSLEQIKNQRILARRLRSELDDIARRVDRTKAEADRMSRDRRRKAQTLAAKKEELDILKKRLAREIAARTKQLSLPFEKTTSLREMPFFLKDGRFAQMSPGTVERAPGGIRPKPGEGTALSQSTDPAVVEKVFSQCDPNAHYIAVVLWEDSFDRWPIVQKALRNKGFSYRLLLLSKGELVQTGGAGGKVQ